MANMYPDEGIDTIFGVFPQNGTSFGTLYMGLFTSQSATTVPSRSATGGAVPSGWTEASGTNYARQAVAAGDWSAPITESTGRKITAPQIVFPAAGGGGWGTANGFFLATQSASGASDKIIFFANFDDETAVTVNAGDIIKITPSMTLLG
jgi:hypothetical protein